MAKWTLQESKEGEVEDCDEESLRSRLRDGELTGFELVRRPGEQTWQPLHSLPMFAEEVPHSGKPEHVAAWRALRGWGGHAAGFFGFSSMFLGMFGWQPWLWWVVGPWAIAFGGHTWRVLPALRVVARTLPGSLDPKSGAHPKALAAADPFLESLARAIEQVDAAFADSGSLGEKPDLRAVRAAAESLHRRRLALESVAAGRAELAASRDALAARIATAPESAKETLATELRALDERLAATDSAIATKERLESRERSLLHQLESIRAAVLRDAGEHAPDPAVSDAVRTLDAALRAEAEIDSTVEPRRNPPAKQTT